MSYLEELFDLKGKIAIVTGAAMGIGAEIAMALMKCGVTVVLTDFNEDKLLETAKNAEAIGGNYFTMKMDVCSPDDIKSVFDTVVEKYGKLDILFNNAGISIRGNAESLSLEDWQRVINTNLTGSFLCAQSAANIMIPQKSGKIINVISTYAFVGRYLRVAYASSKGGMLQMTKTMAMEWAPYGINVNALAPTATKTPMTKIYETDMVALSEMEKKIPMGRLATTKDMIGASLFLASSASDFVTGHPILVDGGFTSV